MRLARLTPGGGYVYVVEVVSTRSAYWDDIQSAKDASSHELHQFRPFLRPSRLAASRQPRQQELTRVELHLEGLEAFVGGTGGMALILLLALKTVVLTRATNVPPDTAIAECLRT